MNARTKQFVATVLLICHWGAISHSQAPEWWVSRQARTLNASPDDYALINQGQLKQLAYAAHQEMEEKLVGGAGPQISALVQSWLAPGGAGRDDYAVANIGQLKALASVFHARLQEAGVAVPYTWTADTGDDADFAPANIGQAKALFAFAIPDQNTGSSLTLKPLKYQQVVELGMTSPLGIWVRLEQLGQPVQAATVNFEVYQSAGGLLYSSNLQATPQSTIQSTTNAQGYAGCQFRAPLQPAYCWIKATAAQASPVWFLMIVGGGDGAFPSNPAEVEGVDYAEDSDSDGDTDAEELAAGNDPKNSASHSSDWKHWSLVTHLHHDYDQWYALNSSEWQPPGYNQYDSSTWKWFGFRTSLRQGLLHNPAPEDLGTTTKPPVSAYPVLNVSTMPPLLSPGWQEGGSARWTSQNTFDNIVTNWWTSAGENDGVTDGQLIPRRSWSAQALKVEIKTARARPYDQNWVMLVQQGVTDKQVIESRDITIPAGSSSTGPMVIYYPPVVEQFNSYSINLLQVELIEVWERDQKWNKVPNPKNPPNYLNAFGIPRDLIRRILFVAEEPQSGKVELTVKTSPNNGSGSNSLLVGFRDTTTSSSGPILPGSKPVAANGLTNIDFTPTGNLKDNDLREFRVVLGVDKNSDGQLTNDEVVMNDAPLGQRFYVKAVTQEDYLSSMDFLDWRDNWGILYPAATNYVRYFDGNDSTLAGATVLYPITVPVSAIANPTHIAGSPYNPTNGETYIPSFRLHDGSAASDAIEDTFDSSERIGIRGLIYNIWDANKDTLAAPFISDPNLQASTQGPFVIADGTSISFYEPDGNPKSDAAKAYGGANIGGIITFGLRRNPSDSQKVILTSVTLTGTVKDAYDFDWTREKTSLSRQAATVQIGWQPPSRKGGRIFVTETEVNHFYNNDSAITRFNDGDQIILPTP